MLSCRKSTSLEPLTKSRKCSVTQLILLKSLKITLSVPPCFLLHCVLTVLDNTDWRFLPPFQQGTSKIRNSSDTLPRVIVWHAPCLGAQPLCFVLWCECHNVVTLQIDLLSSYIFSLQRCFHLCCLVKNGWESFEMLRKGKNWKEKVLHWGYGKTRKNNYNKPWHKIKQQFCRWLLSTSILTAQEKLNSGGNSQ